MRNIPLLSVMVLLICLMVGQGCPPQPPTDPNTIAPTSIGGTMDVASLSIPTGHTTTVTSDVVINATGDVQIDGELTAQPTASGATGCTITINAGGSIEIAGSIQAGSGTDAATATPTMRIAAAAESADAGGTSGGSIELIAKGNITIGETAVLRCGSGGNGADGAWGGAGGKGGDLVIDAGGTLTMNGIIYVGDGGDSGFSMPTVETVQSLTPDQEISLGATGGSSGFIYLRAGQVNWLSYDPGTHSLDYFYASVGGGQTGDASSVTIPSDVATEMIAAAKQTAAYPAAAPMHICSGTSCEFRARNGGDGFILAGLGGNISVTFDQLEADQWDAPAIIVYAGRGGNLVKTPSYKYKDLYTVAMRNGWAGMGGSASVKAANGHEGTASRINAGNGGDATAFAGDGGSAASITDYPQHGGAGGVATAIAGQGGWGYVDISCAVPGGNGGNGGSAYAYGGNGGNGWYAGQAGNAIARGGFGGIGAVGLGPGTGGKGGGATAAGGEAGQSNTAATGEAITGSLATQSPGMDGGDGVACDE